VTAPLLISLSAWHELTIWRNYWIALENSERIRIIKWLRWSGGERAGLWYLSSRVQTQPKPSDFSGEKILSAPKVNLGSFTCRKFTLQHVKVPEKWCGSRHFRQNSRKFLARSSTFRFWVSLASFQTWGTPGGGSWNVLITGPPSWGFDVPLATAVCKNLPAENTQR